MISYLALSIIGVISGLVKGFTSSSGVMIVVPLLKMFFPFYMQNSIGTSLFVDFLSSVAIVFVFYRYRNVDFKTGIWVAIGPILGAQLGARISIGVPELPLEIAFALLMIITGFSLVRGNVDREEVAKKFQKLIKFHTFSERVLTAVALGFLVGVVSGMLGAGGGIMMLLILVFVLGFGLQKGLGTAIFIMALTSLSGTVGYSLYGKVAFDTGVIISIGAVIAGVLGALFINKISEEKLNKIVGGIFLLLGLGMIISLLANLHIV